MPGTYKVQGKKAVDVAFRLALRGRTYETGTTLMRGGRALVPIVARGLKAGTYTLTITVGTGRHRRVLAVEKVKVV